VAHAERSDSIKITSVARRATQTSGSNMNKKAEKGTSVTNLGLSTNCQN